MDRIQYSSQRTDVPNAARNVERGKRGTWKWRQTNEKRASKPTRPALSLPLLFPCLCSFPASTIPCPRPAGRHAKPGQARAERTERLRGLRID